MIALILAMKLSKMTLSPRISALCAMLPTQLKPSASKAVGIKMVKTVEFIYDGLPQTKKQLECLEYIKNHSLSVVSDIPYSTSVINALIKQGFINYKMVEQYRIPKSGELNEDKMSSEEFVNSVKDEVLNNNIYCFTPKGDVIELPRGATPIDFAYRIHTHIGNTMRWAIVNNEQVEDDYVLQNDDRVSIITDPLAYGPRPEREDMAFTTKAKRKIREFHNKQLPPVYFSSFVLLLT